MGQEDSLPVTPRPARPALPRALMILLGTAVAGITVLVMQQLSWLIAPVFLAFVIVILVYPIHVWMLRHRVPAALALIVLLLCIYGVIIGVVSIVVLALGRLATILPRYASEASGLLASFTMLLASFGIAAPQAGSITGALELQRVAGWVTSLLRGVIGFGANVALLLSLLLFFGIESTGAGSRMLALADERPALGQALRDFARNTRRFLGVTTVFGFITGFADTLLLLALDIPLAVLWGLLAAVCNYIPYVGFIIGVVPPALLALLVGDWQLMLVVIVSYIVLNSLFTSLIQPYFVGDAVGISMALTFVALVFWAWVLGPLGAILAIPLTLLVKGVLIDADPRAGWARALFGATPKDPGRPRRRLFARKPTGKAPPPRTAEISE
jgi:predicted PurR-regulated permease PerM